MNTRTKGSAIVALTTSIVLFGNTIASGQTVLRVDIEHGSTSGTGSGWGSDAFKYLQDALAVAAANEPNPYDIWVAQGTYRPDQGQDLPQVGDQREHSFFLRNNVRLYGGFSGQGTETELHERNPESNPTILSGNLDDDEEEYQNNSFHVVRATNVDDTAMLNGFTITHGNGQTYNGGGLRSQDASPLIIRCTFTDNRASFGGGIYARSTGGATQPGPTIVNSRIVENIGEATGGLTYGGIEILVVNTVFQGNVAQSQAYGAAVFDSGNSQAKFVNCTWHGNRIDVECTGPATCGAAFQGYLPSQTDPPEFINCVIWGNQPVSISVEIEDEIDEWQEEISFIVNSSFVLTNTCLRGYDETDLGGTNNIADDPKFVSPSTGNLRLQPGSPAIDMGANNEVVDDVWNMTDNPMWNPSDPGPAPDLDLNDRILDALGDSSAVVDMGAFEFQCQVPD